MQRVMTCKDLGWYLSTPRTEKLAWGRAGGPRRGSRAMEAPYEQLEPPPTARWRLVAYYASLVVIIPLGTVWSFCTMMPIAAADALMSILCLHRLPLRHYGSMSPV